MKKISFCTLGCKVNQYETEAVIKLFKDRGYEISDFDEICDVYLINTCTVTAMGERKSRQMIHRAHAKNPDALIAVMGCYSQISPETVAKIEGVALVLGTSERQLAPDMVEEYFRNREKTKRINDIMKKKDYEELWISSYEDKTRAFVKIEDGCTEFCSYCIIPYARGPVRSREPENIKKEAETLAMEGYREIVLTGIHLGSYGRDLEGQSLIDAVKAVHSVDAIRRIRIGSVEPRTLSEEFINELKALPKVCPHFHISLQSGCERTLKAMNRKYTLNQYREAVHNLRQAFDNPAITTDIIAGFPDESEKDFADSLEFMKEIRFSEAHIFPYSPRKGTKAAQMDGQIDKKIKNARAKEMIAVSEALHCEYMEQNIGCEAEVLFERCIGGNVYEGHMANYITVRARSDDNISHKFAKVRLSAIEGGHIIGEIIK